MKPTGRRPTKPNLQNTPAPTGRRGEEIRRHAMSTGYVLVRCVLCKAERKIKSYEVPEGEMPGCKEPGCFSIMIAIEATAE